MFSITTYKKNGVIADKFASGTKKDVTEENYIKSITDYVDSLCPLEERLENGVDSLEIKLVTEQEAIDFINTHTIVKHATSKHHKD
ncbi:hypothetical protein [Proteus phage PM2]|uniref:Uncharacterized protein n=2 Tax=Bragavirus TaxID=2948639 RepID=A0A0G2SSN0_9CAUD|nr:hypothetical protein AVT59_gp131 [Proteus phage vB_PmiM_Pm5461]YP_010092118.1 hypothetical protein KNT71_gp122 [Proteus phage PM2]AKA62106.1 hypothetical protein Pm5461_240 [Proteus phage vB_PmiM_Pm5461]ASZ76510.1 hypothetical protein [Proteus phage PM2]